MIEWLADFKVIEVKFVQLFLFVIGLVIFALLVRRTPLENNLQNKRNAWIKRALPVFEMTLFLALMIWGIYAIFNDQPTLFIVLAIILSGILLWASQFAIKDFVCGVILKAEELYQVHDHIHFDDTEGWITKIGIRSLQITASDGQQIRIPYSRISDTLFAKTTKTKGSFVHTFRLEIAKSERLSAAIETIRLTIVNCIWSSVVNEPSVRYDSDGGMRYGLEITVYTTSSDYFSRIEDTVRRTIGVAQK